MKIIKQKMGEGEQGVLCGFMEPKKINEVNSSTFYISHKYSLNHFRKYCAFTNSGFGAIPTH